MRHLLLLLFILLTACTPPAGANPRATAEVAGCWPYAAYQPPTPTTAPTTTPDRLARFHRTPGVIPTFAPPDTPTPTMRVFRPCTPEPGQPTITPRPTPPQTPIVPGAMGGRQEISTTLGKNTSRSIAIQAGTGRAVVGWINWGTLPPEAGDSGQVWVRAQDLTSGAWLPATTLTTSPVNGGVGGLSLTFLLSDTVIAAWGDGRNAIWMAESPDGGKTWGMPERIGTFAYQVIRLLADDAGGLHLLTLTGAPHQLRYSTRLPGRTSWSAPVAVAGGTHYKADLAVLIRPDGTLRRLVVWTDTSGLKLARSDTGTSWTPIAVETGRFMSETAPDFPAIVAVARDAGDLVAVSWSQYSAGGLFAQISTDGGQTWGREERVAQHQASGDCYDAGGGGLSCAYQPSLAYDAGTDRLIVVWVEVLRRHNPPSRVRLSSRSLTTNTWRFAIAPDGVGDPPPILADWGWRGSVAGTRDHGRHWLLLLDEKNDQDRVSAQPIVLAAWLAEGDS